MPDTPPPIRGRVSRHSRNPRRAYDADGRMIEPPTVGQFRADAETTVEARCTACEHTAIVSTDRLPDFLQIPDVALRLKCSSCGARRITVRDDMKAHYARMRDQWGWSAGNT